MQNEHKNLMSKIEKLEKGNSGLNQGTEDILLLGLAAEIIYQTEDSVLLVDQILERISILKDIPFCGCLELGVDGLLVEGLYASFGELKKNEVHFEFTEISSRILQTERYLIIDEPEFGSYGFSLTLSNQSFRPSSALIIPCFCKGIYNRYFVFLDDGKYGSRFPQMLTVMQQIVQLAAERLVNIFMYGELNRLNGELDRRVKERTEELTQTNRNLNREISERKVIEKALRANERKLRSVYNAAIDVSFITFDLSDKFIIRSFSPGAEKMFGFLPKEVIGKPIEQFHLLNQADFFPTLKQDFEQMGWSRHDEITMLRNSGESFTAMLTVYPLYDEDLKLIDALAVCIDISELKQTQNQLINAREKAEENEFKFRNLFEQASDGIFITNSEGDFLELNESGCEMLGYTKDELLKLNLSDVILRESLKKNPIKRDEMADGKVAIAQRILIRKDRSRFQAEISGKMVSDGRMQGMVRDITDRKKFEVELIAAKERAEENDRLKTSFLQNMSHEIRTPMNAILGFADLLPEYFGDKEALNKFANIIKQRGTDLLEIINDILDIARIESGQIMHNPEYCKMDGVFAEIENSFHKYQTRIKKNHIEFNLKVPDNVRNLEIVIDKVKLKQILLNLVANAFKFTSSGKIEVGCTYSDYQELLFYVSDTGIGISEEKHAEIFNRFTQATHDTSQLYGGTGLGLSIVKGLLDLIGGRIWLDSKIGKGTTFYFSLPFISTSGFMETSLPEKVESEPEMVDGVILVVEDDEFNTRYLKEILRDSGFTFVHCMYGEKAIEICNTQQIHLVLMDIRLPDITGYEAIREIRKTNQSLKIIVQTAYATPEDKEKAFDVGCDDYLSKPIKSDLLLSRIHFYLKHFKHQVQS